MKITLRKQNIANILMWASLLAILLLFQFRGITYYDEGYILDSALRVANGEIPYKHFDMVYTPLSFVVTSGFIKIFGESIFAGRLAALTFSIASLVALYLLLKHVTKKKLLIYGGLLFFVAWGPTHINFPWPTMFALCFFLYATLFYLLGVEKKSGKCFFLSGIMTALTILSKQNFGAGTTAVLFLSFLFINIPNKKQFFLKYILGFLAMSGLYFFYLVLTSSLMPFFQNMNLYTLQRVFVNKALETPFLYEGSLPARFFKLLFYTSPLIISAVAFFVTRRSSKKIFLIPILTTIFYLLGIRPTTDYVHLVSLVALAGLPLCLIVVFSKQRFIKYGAIGFLSVMIVAGFYTALFKGYYQWEYPLNENNYFAPHQRMKVYLKETQVVDAYKIINYIQSRTKNDEYIFVNSYTPMVYFLSDRKNPTPYDLISSNQLPRQYQEHIISRLKEMKVKLVVIHYLNIDENALVTNYIKKNYKKTNSLGGYIFFEK